MLRELFYSAISFIERRFQKTTSTWQFKEINIYWVKTNRIDEGRFTVNLECGRMWKNIRMHVCSTGCRTCKICLELNKSSLNKNIVLVQFILIECLKYWPVKILYIYGAFYSNCRHVLIRPNNFPPPPSSPEI